MNDLVSIIANIGFPIAITIFLLVRIESKLETLADSIDKLANAITKIK